MGYPGLTRVSTVLLLCSSRAQCEYTPQDGLILVSCGFISFVSLGGVKVLISICKGPVSMYTVRL